MGERKKVKIFLSNGFKYSGDELPGDNIFYWFIDSKDGIKKKVPFTSISLIENLGGDSNDK